MRWSRGRTELCGRKTLPGIQACHSDSSQSSKEYPSIHPSLHFVPLEKWTPAPLSARVCLRVNEGYTVPR